MKTCAVENVKKNSEISGGEGSRISVIVPVHNGGAKFKRCLMGIQSARPRPDELIVVADGDAHGSGQMAEGFGIKVISIGPPPMGPAGARNVGAKAAKGDILFFVDADVEIHGDCVGSDLNLTITDRISCALVFALLVTLPLIFISKWGWGVTGFFLVLILFLNRDLYFYFMRLRGIGFLFKSILMHCFYFFYSGLAFMFGKITCKLKE